MVMAKNEFYSVVLKKRIIIPSNKIKEVVRGKRRFAVGTYTANKKQYEAWKVLGLAKKK